MNSRTRPALLFALLLPTLLLFDPGSVRAWDRKRHKQIERQAAALLPADVRDTLAPFFVEPARLFTGIDPDALKKKGAGRCSSPLHYVNPDGRRYEQHRPAKNGDAVTALVFLEDRLRELLGNPRANRREVALALALWIHIAADLSQPLHSGFKCDRGGNSQPVAGARRSRNLHALWDGRLLDLLRRAGGNDRPPGPGAALVPSVDLDYAAWSSQGALAVPAAYRCANGRNSPGCAICRKGAQAIQIDEKYIITHGATLAASAAFAPARVAGGLTAMVRKRPRTPAELALRSRLRSMPGTTAVRRCFDRLKRL